MNYFFSFISQMFGGMKEHRAIDDPEVDLFDAHHKESAWQPSFIPVASYTKPLRHPDSHHHKAKPVKTSSSSTTTYHHNLPYDSYNPRYNHNPNGDGYQDDWEGSQSDPSGDLNSSSSSKRIKKAKAPDVGSPVTGPKGKKAGKRPQSGQKEHSWPKVGKKNRLETELRPPPPHKRW